MSFFSFAIYLFNTYIRERIGFIKTWGPNDTPSTFTSRFLFAIMFIAFTHNGMRSLKELLARASALNNDLQGKYRTLIESDEEIRDQAARYIHDRVQAEITLVSSKLNKVALSEGDEIRNLLTPVISDLEKIRSIDLKLVSQILTPNFAAEGLKGAIETLCEQYKSGIEYQIAFDERVKDCDEELSLGIYRIIEQGIINAITHGPASKVTINVAKTDYGIYLVEVSDNGPGALNAKPGIGTVIIEAWCSILHGVKEIESDPKMGYTLRVTIPASPRT
jgi:signal transduction histidine kinase